MGHFAKKIHVMGGIYCNNPDGREDLRKKYAAPVRKYWRISEHGMVKHSDFVICDSLNIEKLIQADYKEYNPKTTFIAYGSDILPSTLSDNDPNIRIGLNSMIYEIINFMFRWEDLCRKTILKR